MKQSITTFILLLTALTITTAQTSCEEFKDSVQQEDYGMTYYSYSSDAITKVSFHEITDDSYNTYYFAIVQFTSQFTEYIYQVGSRTKWNYSMDYSSGAGEAFWEHIQPYADILGCAPNF